MSKSRASNPKSQAGKLASIQGMPLGTAQFYLCTVWIIGAAFGLGTLLLQTVYGAYLAFAKDAWTLFAPLYVSTLSLLLGAIVASAIIPSEPSEEKVVRRKYYSICLLVSIGANLIYTASLWMQPLMVGSGAAPSPIEALKLSMLWMVPIQGVVAVALGGLLGAGHSVKKQL